MKRNVIILAGVFCVLFGPALILPALAKHKQLEIWNYDIVWPIVVGAIITIVGMGIAAFGFKKRTA